MKALIIGAGISGIGVSRLLLQQGYTVTLYNDGSFPEQKTLEEQGVKVYTTPNELPYDEYEYVIKNPGISPKHAVVKKYKNILNEIEIAGNFAPDYKIFAVSGTNGKTTTTSMLGEMLQLKNKKNIIAGNIGISFSDVVATKGNESLEVALEISAFQMEGTPTLSPYAYTLTNLTPDHLDRYEDVEDYYGAKLEIIPRCKYFIRNIDDPIIRKNVSKDHNVLDISLVENTDIYIHENKVMFKDMILFEVKNLKLVGKHNLMNAMMAASLAYLAKVAISDIQKVVASFSGVEHRLEYVDTIDAVTFYNDSKATNPESLEVCLQSFDRPIRLLAGGYDKHISFEGLSKYQDKIKSAYFFGESKEQMQKEMYPKAILVDDLSQAMSKLQTELEEDDIVVLSPGCASYDQFKNFEERGTIFKDMVKSYKKL